MQRYCMEHIELRLGLRRGDLICAGLLLGCDYLPKGVPGVGLVTFRGAINELQGQELLPR